MASAAGRCLLVGGWLLNVVLSLRDLPAVARRVSQPIATDPRAPTTHHAIVVNGKEEKTFQTQSEAAEWAKSKGYAPIHVA